MPHQEYNLNGNVNDRIVDERIEITCTLLIGNCAQKRDEIT